MNADRAGLTYAHVGASIAAPPATWDVDTTRGALGRGEELFERASDAVLALAMFDQGWVSVARGPARVAPGDEVVVRVRLPGFTRTNPCRVLRVIDEEAGALRRRGFVYGTLRGHAESGEEAFVVVWDRARDEVAFEIVAFSRPAWWLARLGQPAVRVLQRRFGVGACRALARVVGSGAPQVTQRSRDGHGLATWSATWGAVLWCAAILGARPDPLLRGFPEALLLLAAAVATPLALRLAGRDAERPRSWRAAVLLQPLAALALAVSFALPRGAAAAACALPWLATSACAAFAGALRALRRQRATRRVGPLADLCLDAGLLAFPVGAAWAVAYRAGVQPGGFADVVVLLTAVHFHVAGLMLLTLTGTAALRRPGRLARVACVGVLAGLPLTAAGITATHAGAPPLFETACALATAGAGLCAAALQWSAAPPATLPRAVLRAAAIALVVGMLLAARYALRTVVPLAHLDVPHMAALHGTMNLVLFALPALVVWCVSTDGAA